MLSDFIRTRLQRTGDAVLGWCGFLTDAQLDRIASRRAELSERIQQGPGVSLEQAARRREEIDRVLAHAPDQRSGRCSVDDESSAER